MSEFIKNLKNGVIAALFPEKLTCEICGRDVFDKSLLCNRCAESLSFIDGAHCYKCGRATTENTSGCASCKNLRSVDLAGSVFSYEGGGEKLVKKFKYSGARYLADDFAKMMKVVYYKNTFAPDIVTFVPMTDKKRYERGYNQSELLAESLCREVGAKCKDLFVKVKETRHQAGLGFSDRRVNLDGAFKLKDARAVKNKKVLIVDDVLTTGATSEELAALLKDKGAKSVYLLTVASVPAKTNIEE